MAVKRWKIGELAKATGLTVRTLHHYDEIGLLVPKRSPAGHRVYADRDVRRLYQIVALRQLGFPLEEIAACLERAGSDLGPAMRRHLERLEQQLDLQERLRQRLLRALETLDRAGEPSTDRFLEMLEVMTKMERYYTPEQLEQRRSELGDEAIRRAEQEWSELINAVKVERARGADPAGPRMQELARRWQDLIEQFTGGDPGIRRSLQKMYEQEGVETASRGMVSAELAEYVQRAIAAGSSPA
jgi:DNA-binding transcriptional MerR regulator